MKDNTTENLDAEAVVEPQASPDGPDALQQQALAELEAQNQRQAEEMQQQAQQQQAYTAEPDLEAHQRPLEEELKPTLQNSSSAVAVDPKQNKLLILGALFVAGFAVYYFFFSSDPNVKPTPSDNTMELPAASNRPPAEENVATVTTLPSLPSPPPLVAPTPPPPPTRPSAPIPQSLPNNIPMPNIPNSSNISVNQQVMPSSVVPPSIGKATSVDMSARQKSGIMMGGGGGGGGGGAAPAAGTDPNTKGKLVYTSDNFALSHTGAAQENAKTIGNMGNLIAQGKLIDAVLETAINTDFPGTVRAIVSRDVYAEAGKNILVPKGSRLIGNYATGVKKGQRRIAISWTRIIRSDGIDITIDSQSVDQLGRMGTDGYLDNKYFEMMTNSLLVSTINIGIVQGVSKLIPAANAPITTVTPGTGTATTPAAGGGAAAAATNGTTTTATPTQQALQDALTKLGTNMQQMAADSSAILPTMTIDQGTLLKVFVSKDLIFPGRVASQIRYVQ